MSRILTDKSFETEVLQSAGLKMVDFWAEWCGPCRALAPTIESLAEEHRESLSVFKHNVDSDPMTPARFNVRSIPTVLFFKDGKLVDQLIGNHSKEVFSNTIKKYQ